MEIKNVLEKSQMCEKTISLIGNKWSLMIVNEFNLIGKPLRFNMLLEKLSPISSKTLSAKLKELVQHKILDKNIISTSPVIANYSLTQKGKDLAGLFESMASWGKKWNPHTI